ncbi:hypothetical protein niasHT_014134 [Heterodera trifolii]|uniref:Protein kinase domain-containing protein n=1 Tax=Heterodera trifolii TaxID=157864 RepID=A0ABD2KWV1_9BILA
MDHGTMDESERFAKIFEPVVVIMELGERDLEEELQLVKGNFSTDKFNKMVIEVMGILVQLHKVGIIHRDIAARNYIVFEKKEEANLIKRIKLADFDDSVPYLDGEEKASEEDLKDLKTDIKQAGLLISQMANIKILWLTNEQAFYTSRCIKTLFKCANREAISAFAAELSWQKILDILMVWKELPGISFLVGNMTSKDREQRMTAKGVADFLEGKCKPMQNGKSPEANCMRRDRLPDNPSVDNPSVENASVENAPLKDSWNVHLKMTLFGDVLAEKKLDDFEKIVIPKTLTSAMEGIEHFVHELAERTEFCDQ